MTRARDIADLAGAADAGTVSGANLIINGDFAVSQRGTSFTADNVYTIDRWKSGDGTGGTPARTLSQEEFSLGQTDVPNARYYLKHNQTGASTSGNSSLSHRIEDVTRFDGSTVTLSFYAKADAAMDIDIRFIQDFGTGGSPSSDVSLTETVSIGTSWTKYTVTKTLGSISGKTVGTDGEHTSFLNIDMEFQPTSTFTFEASLFKLEYGSVATPFLHESYAENLAKCQRYYVRMTDNTSQSSIAYGRGASSGQSVVCAAPIPVPLRASPTITSTGAYHASDSNSKTSFTPTSVTVSGFSLYSTNLGLFFSAGTTICDDDRVTLIGGNGATTLEISAEL